VLYFVCGFVWDRERRIQWRIGVGVWSYSVTDLVSNSVCVFRCEYSFRGRDDYDCDCDCDRNSSCDRYCFPNNNDQGGSDENSSVNRAIESGFVWDREWGDRCWYPVWDLV